MSRFDTREMYDRYRVQIAFRDRLCGGTPLNSELIRTWVDAKMADAPEEIRIRVAKEDAELVVNDVQERCWNGFFADEHGPLIQTRQVKAALKQSAKMLGITNDKRGSKQILAEGLEVFSVDGGDRLHLGMKKATGTIERPIHVQTTQGPRAAFKRVDYATGVKLTFEIWVLKTAAQEKRHIGEDDLVKILTFAQNNGIGADRSQGEGKFDVVEFQRI